LGASSHAPYTGGATAMSELLAGRVEHARRAFRTIAQRGARQCPASGQLS